MLSTGQTVWCEANLEPGFYVALCFLTDPDGEATHVLDGMIATVEVSAACHASDHGGAGRARQN